MLITFVRRALAASFLISFTTAPGAATGSGEIAWFDDPGRALAQSAGLGRPVLVDVWAVWCVPCKKMDETAYRSPEVVEAMRSFVPLKVDHDAQETFVERHAVEALPAVLFLDEHGREIARLNGLIDAGALVAGMERVHAGYAAYLENRERESDPAAAVGVAEYLRGVGNPRAAVELLRQKLKDKKPIAPELRETMQLHLALAQSTIGDTKAAIPALESLARDSSVPRLRGQALAGLVRAYRARGASAEAEATLTRLRGEFPDLAADEFPAE